jgi:hypothetical protein
LCYGCKIDKTSSNVDIWPLLFQDCIEFSLKAKLATPDGYIMEMIHKSFIEGACSLLGKHLSTNLVGSSSDLPYTLSATSQGRLLSAMHVPLTI